MAMKVRSQRKLADELAQAAGMPTKAEFFDPKNVYLDLLGLPVAGMPAEIGRVQALKNVARQFKNAPRTAKGSVILLDITDKGELMALPITHAKKNLKQTLRAIMAAPQRELDRIEDVYIGAEHEFPRGSFSPSERTLRINLGMRTGEPATPFDVFFHELTHGRQVTPEMGFSYEGPLAKALRKSVPAYGYKERPLEQMARKVQKRMRRISSRFGRGRQISQEEYNEIYKRALKETVEENIQGKLRPYLETELKAWKKGKK